MDGNPSPEQAKKAFIQMQQAAQLDYLKALTLLGHYYHQGRGVEVNFDEAMRWYKKAAEKDGFAADAARNNIGLMYFRGEGVPKDNQEAIKWLQRAADNGYTSATKNLKFAKGQTLYNEARELSKNNPSEADLKKSFELMLQAAETDYGWAMWHTAENYREGKGTPQNYEQALYWYRLVAELDHKAAPVAQNNIGLFYYRGQGVTKDRQESLKWLQRAADNGYANAAESLKNIQDRIKGSSD